MKPETAKKNLPIITAFSEGKTVQVWDGGAWYDMRNPKFDDDFEYRIKPEPKFRPWRPEEVPIGAQLRNMASGSYRALILAVNCDGDVLAVNNNPAKISSVVGEDLESLSLFREHSTDGGTTWKGCGVYE